MFPFPRRQSPTPRSSGSEASTTRNNFHYTHTLWNIQTDQVYQTYQQHTHRDSFSIIRWPHLKVLKKEGPQICAISLRHSRTKQLQEKVNDKGLIMNNYKKELLYTPSTARLQPFFGRTLCVHVLHSMRAQPFLPQVFCLIFKIFSTKFLVESLSA